MFTVIILSKHSSDLLKDFRFLFKPFVEKEIISFCEWNESGTDITTSVPDLYKVIKGKTEWRAIIVSAEEIYGKRKDLEPNEKNPFDFPGEVSDNQNPCESRVPIIRLTHMLCGYPASPVKNFEEGYEYVDEYTGKTCRVRISDLTQEEIYALSEKYNDGLKKIYLAERVSEETEKARKALEGKYTFTDIRPQEVYLVSTCRHSDEEDNIYESWRDPFEMESSDFCYRNNYPVGCRFLCYSITNTENSRYMRELTEFWLAVLTLSINKIPASTLQAYKLYRLGVTISTEELSHLLNNHLNKMEAVSVFVQERLKMKPEYSFREDEQIIEKQHIPVIFEETTASDLYIDTGHIGLSRDCPEEELKFWNTKIREKEVNIDRFLKMPRRAIDRASRYVKDRVDSFFDNEYELDRFQIEDLQEELNSLELQLLTSNTHSVIDEQRIRAEVNKVDCQVKKEIASRMPRRVVVSTGVAILLIYMIGYFPYIFNSLKLGETEFFTSLGLTLVAVFFASIGGIIALALLRNRLIKKMECFNKLMRELADSVNGSAKKFEKYFSVLCTYMKGQSIYSGLTKKSDVVSERVLKLRMHKQALQMSIKRDEEYATAFGVKRIADFEKNVTSFFDEDKFPKDNALYYFEMDRSDSEIPLNKTGDTVRAPYKFIAGLVIERKNIYEEEKGED